MILKIFLTLLLLALMPIIRVKAQQLFRANKNFSKRAKKGFVPGEVTIPSCDCEHCKSLSKEEYQEKELEAEKLLFRTTTKALAQEIVLDFMYLMFFVCTWAIALITLIYLTFELI